ncbi:hypothetical protein HQQ80_11815 [Microbacteriaceae bacterium VKM Ac-2855]|nr:hypothetical protein [Microbacteriaceae bacterium VKM Ac-2855]
MTYTLNQGWGVQLMSGQPTAAELATVEASAVTGFGSHQKLSDFPADVELATRPRRMVHLAASDGTSVYLHAVEAGTDSTGRPNNVYNHVVFDRNRHDVSVPVRPIEFWRSPDLLVPWNHLEVAASQLTPVEAPRTGEVVGLDSVVSFVCDPSSWRAGVLSVLMDAVAAALDGGAPVVLVSDDQDTAALWLGAVERLMSPASARDLCWSLYERAIGLPAVWARGIHVAVVPRADAQELVASESLVVIDEAEMPEIGQLGGAAHITAAGSVVVASDWSAMAQMVLVDEVVARRVLLTLDSVADRVGDADLSVEWPLAMAVVLLGDETADALESASRVLLDSSPDGIRKDAELFERTAHVVAAQIGSTTWGVWKEIAEREPDASRLVSELMASAYLERCLFDDEWLLRDEAVPLPVPLSLPDAERERLRLLAAQAVTALSDRIASREPATGAVVVLRLIDLLLRSGLISGRPVDAATVEEVREIVGQAVVPLLEGESGVAVVIRTGVVDQRLRERIILPLVAAARSENTLRGPLAEEVLGWLCGGTTDLPEALRARVVASIEPLSPLHLELVLWHLRVGEPAPGALSNAVYSLLLESGDWNRIAPLDRAVLERALLRPEALRVPELAQLEEEFGGSIPAEFLEENLAAAPASAALEKLGLRVLRSRRGSRSARIAAVRLRCAGVDGLLPGEAKPTASSLRMAIREMAGVVGADRIPAEVASLFVALTVLAMSRRPYGPAWSAAAETVRRSDAASLEPTRAALANESQPGPDEWSVGAAEIEAEITLIRALSAAAVAAAESLRRNLAAPDSQRSVTRLALLSFITSPDFPDPTAADPRAHALSELRVPDGEGGDVRLLDDALRDMISAGIITQDDLVPDVIERLVAILVQRRERGDDRMISAIERSAKAWQRELRGAKSRGPLLGGFASFLSDRKER